MRPSAGVAKVPRTPPADLTYEPDDVIELAPQLWRIHRTAGAHVLAWDELRHYGPLPTMRYDPHPEPTLVHAEGVQYAATDLATALAGVFQASHTVDTISARPQLTVWTPIRPLHLLNLTDLWAVRNGAANSLAAAARSTGRAWARAIHTTRPDLDGLWTRSTMTGRPTVVLWNPAADSFPPAPDFSRPLADPTLHAIVERIAVDELHYQVL